MNFKRFDYLKIEPNRNKLLPSGAPFIFQILHSLHMLPV